MKKNLLLSAALLAMAGAMYASPVLAQSDVVATPSSSVEGEGIATTDFAVGATAEENDEDAYIEFSDEDYIAEDVAVYDPIEPFNRAVFRFNNVVDMLLLEPASKVYTRILPPPARTGIGNFLSNLRSPLFFANELLQLDFKGAGKVASRFVINTLAGWGGVFDPAERTGLIASEEDFGQTLAVWGAPAGPYIVIPLLGPSNVRDIAGKVPEYFIEPVDLALKDANQEKWVYIRAGTSIIHTRAELAPAIDATKEQSLDYYASVRSAYLQSRSGAIAE